MKRLYDNVYEFHMLVTSILTGKSNENDYTKFINRNNLETMYDSLVPINFKNMIIDVIEVYLYEAFKSNILSNDDFKYISSFDLNDFKFKLLIDILKATYFDPIEPIVDHNILNIIIQYNKRNSFNKLHHNLLEYIILSRLSMGFYRHKDTYDDCVLTSLIKSISNMTLLESLYNSVMSQAIDNEPYFYYALLIDAFKSNKYISNLILSRLIYYVVQEYKFIPNLKQLTNFIDDNIDSIAFNSNYYIIVIYLYLIHKESISNIISKHTDGHYNPFHWIISTLDYVDEIHLLNKETYNSIPDSPYKVVIYFYFVSKRYYLKSQIPVPKIDLKLFANLNEQFAELVCEMISKVVIPEYEKINFEHEPENYINSSAFLNTNYLYENNASKELLCLHFQHLYSLGNSFIRNDIRDSMCDVQTLSKTLYILYEYDEAICKYYSHIMHKMNV